MVCCNVDGTLQLRPKMSSDAYMSAGSVDGTASTIDKIGQISMFASRFPFIKKYQIEMILAGQSGQVQLRKRDPPVLLYGAELKPTFFDAELFFNQTQVACYNDRTGVSGFRHSGDLTADNHFMHSMECVDFVQGVYCAAALSYNSNMSSSKLNRLTDYEAVSPFIILVDHVREVMLAIPFSLERATVGDSMRMGPLIFHIDNRGLLRWYAPLTCPLDGVAKVGDFTPNFRAKMATITRDFEADFARHGMESLSGSSEIEVAVKEPTLSPSLSTFNEIVFVQDGVNPLFHTNASVGRLFAAFGTTLDITRSFTPKKSSKIVLPILSGEAHGHAALALGSKVSTEVIVPSSPAWRELVDRCASVVVHAMPGAAWYEGVLQAQTHRVVGLLVVHLPQELSCDALSRKKAMTEMKLSAVRIMSGISIVLLATPSGKAFFYRGAIELLPIYPDFPSFGEEVALEETIRMHSARERPLTVGSFLPNSFDCVLLKDGQLLQPKKDVSAFEELAMCGGKQWETALAQLSVSLSTAEADTFKARLTSIVLAKEKKETQGMQQEVARLVANLKKAYASCPAHVDPNVHALDEQKAIIGQKKLLRDAQTVYRKALGRIEQVCSLRIVSARIVGVQQAQRKAAVQQNIARAANLSDSALAKQLMDCTYGFAVAKVDHASALELLTAISASGMERYLEQLATNAGDVLSLDQRSAGFGLASNCTVLEPEIAQSLMEHRQTSEHILSVTKGKQLTYCDMYGTPHLLLPLYNDSAMLNGDYVDFMARANDEHIANYRVSLRNMCCNLKHRLPIKGNSPDLTFGIQMIVLSLMLSIARVQNVKTLEPDSTVCETLRGLMFLWGTFAGSGQRSVTFAYQLTQPGAEIAQPKNRGDWTLYALVAYLYPYTRVPLDGFKANVRTLLVTALRRGVVLPLCKGKTLSTEQKKNVRLQCDKDRNAVLRWNYAACSVLMRVDRRTISLDDGASAAKRLLAVLPAGARTYTTEQLVRSLTLLTQGQPLHWPIVRAFVACAYIKRSGIFADAKRERTVFALVRAKVMMADSMRLPLPKDVVTISDGEEAPAHMLYCGKVTGFAGTKLVYRDPTVETDVKLQNEKAYLAKDHAKMLGDAELTRVAWRVGDGTTDDGRSNADFLRAMLPSIVKSVDAASAKSLMIVKDDCPVSCKENKQLADLWVTAHVLSPSTLDKVIPSACLQMLFGSIGVASVDQPRAIGDVIRILMKNKEKADCGEIEARQHLKTAFDCSDPIAIS